MRNLTIPKRLTKGEELVVVQKNDFEAFKKWQREASDALVKVRRGRQEHRKGKTVTASSPRRFR